MFRYAPIQYPDEYLVLGRYLVPETDVGPEITDKTMKAKGEVLHWPTYRGLEKDKKSNQDHIFLRKYFVNIIRDKLGPDISSDKFPDIN